jgi:hypothetical protein
LVVKLSLRFVLNCNQLARTPRRLAEQSLVKPLAKGKAGLGHAAATAAVAALFGEAYASDRAFLDKFERDHEAVSRSV